MPSTVKLAEYLFKRLHQLGVRSIHGVPGDYNLTLLDYVEPAGHTWVGNANELNAGYAADGYARVKGIGALITTFGVGELSAINAIACSYAERAAVVHIVGTPDRATQDSRALVHHTFNNGDYRRFGEMHKHVTVAQTSLRDPRSSPEQIDEVLKACLLHSRPVYIEVPVDLVPAPVFADRLDSEIRLPEVVPNTSQETALAEILNRIYAAKQPAILVDGEIRAFDAISEVRDFVQLTKWPTWTTPFSKGLVDESLPNYHGVWQGMFDTAAVKEFMESTDLVLVFGPHYSSTNSYSWTSIPKETIAVSFRDTEIKVGGEIFRDVPAKHIISQLLKSLDSSKVKRYDPYPQDLPHYTLGSFSDVSSSEALTQEKFWRILANILQPGDIVMGETGSAGYGCRDMLLPAHAKTFIPTTWLSIGYMLPAAQGAALAQRELIEESKYHGINNARTILMIGDGSFQMTVQELGTIIRLNLDVILILINNDGYTIERVIHGLKAKYNDISRWRYLQAPGFFGASEDTYTASARTWGELDEVLKSVKLTKGKGLRMVEVFMDREDSPPGIMRWLLQRQMDREQSKEAS